MEYFWGIAALLFAIMAVIAVIFLHKREKEQEEKVLSSSRKIHKLQQLNQNIRFHNIPREFSIQKHYDNKGSYMKIKPAYLMTAEIRDRILFFEEHLRKVRENREKLNEYNEQISLIQADSDPVDFSALQIKESVYRRIEEKLFQKMILTPVTDCTYNVAMSYSSPQGRVQLFKSESFHYQEIFSCLESVSRSHLDRSTYDALAAAERGEISDSLRYDILRRDNFKCVICGASADSGARLHVDHIIPIAKGGKSVPENLRTLCERCNVGKGAKIETAEPAKESPETERAEEKKALICERCGAALVRRTGKYGDFYGCSRYPECRFTKKIL